MNLAEWIATEKRRAQLRFDTLCEVEERLAADLQPTFTAAKVAELCGVEIKTAYSFCYRMRAKELVENVGAGVWRVKTQGGEA